MTNRTTPRRLGARHRAIGALAGATVAVAVALVTGCGKKAADTPKAAQSNFTETCETDDFCIDATRDTGLVDFALKGFPLTNLTLTLNFQATNMQSTITLPLTTSAKGEGLTTLTTLRVTDPSAAFSYKFDYKWGYGLPTAQHDDATIYRLPFEAGASFKVVQGYNGTFTHFGEEKYAVDFAMPEGTPVVAARGGTVLATEASFDQGGTDPALKSKANYVKILHDDGTIGQYLHFRKNGVLVKRAQEVTPGTPLGASGNTGYTSGPHLHFEVSKRVDGATRATLPTKFKAAEGASIEIVQGQSYTAEDL